MSLPSLGPALELPPVAEPFPIDLGSYQRRITAQLQQKQGRLAELDQERQQLTNAVIGLRGQLDLIAELVGNQGQEG